MLYKMLRFVCYLNVVFFIQLHKQLTQVCMYISTYIPELIVLVELSQCVYYT